MVDTDDKPVFGIENTGAPEDQATRGVRLYRSLLENTSANAIDTNDLATILRAPKYAPYRDELAAVLIGAKPCQLYENDPRIKVIMVPNLEGVLENYDTSDDFCIDSQHRLFYSKKQVVAVIRSNPTVFPDFTQRDAADIETYVCGVFELPFQTEQERSILWRKQGLILGYPSDAVEGFALHQEKYVEFDTYALEHAEENPILSLYTSSEKTADKINEVRDKIRDSVRQLLDQLPEFSQWDDSVKDYIADLRVIEARGYTFTLPASSSIYSQAEGQAFKQQMDAMFRVSQIDTVTTSILNKLGWD